MTKVFAIIVLLALGACSPGNACKSYGFEEHTTAYSQCVQNEVLAYQQRLAKSR